MIDKYNQRAQSINSLLCVGLDSDISRIPEPFLSDEFPQFAFNQHIIQQTHEYVAAYKPNIAFYEARGPIGLTELQMTMAYLQEEHPTIYTICDAKRSDIGSTSEAYATAVFDLYGFDSVTLNPFLGRDSLQPFLSRADKGCIILCRTSNAGATDFQDLNVEGIPLWQYIADTVYEVWNEHQNCMLVVGATYPEEMKQIRKRVGQMPLLVPGIGAQGGNIQQTVESGKTTSGLGLIINSSRGIIFAEDPARASRELRDAINQYR